jgi:AmiR/NasT family two-component response regulator
LRRASTGTPWRDPSVDVEAAGMSAVIVALEEKVANLEIALATNRRIGIAIGILMQAGKITEDEAFDSLRIVSQRTQERLSVVAARVAHTGTLDDSAA